MPELLIWTGTHPDEKRSLELGDSLRQSPLPHVTTDIANPEAHKQNVRLVDINLMHAYPGGATSDIYEVNRAVEVLEKSQEFDYVIDVHQASDFGETTAIIDKKQGATLKILGLLGAIGIRNLILSEGTGMYEHLPNSFLLEMGKDLSINRLRRAIDTFANSSHPFEYRTTFDFTWFEYLESLHEKHLHPDSLDAEQRDSLQPFEEFSEMTKMLGRKAHIMSWSFELNKQGYWGELITPINQPDIRHWPT